MKPKMIKCPYCGAVNLPDSAFCAECGNRLQPETPIHEVKSEMPHNQSHSTAAKSENSYAGIRKGVIAVIALILLIACIVILGVVFGWFSDDSSSDSYPQFTPTQDYTEPVSTPEITETAEAPEVQQVLYVRSSGSKATLTLSEWVDGEWQDIFSAPAYIGKNGISYNKVEGDRCTPAGEFNILYYLAVDENYDSRLNFHPVCRGDIWVFDPDSSRYNTLQVSGSNADWDSALTEDMYAKFTEGNSVACIMFDYNGDGGLEPGVRNMGSDLFIDGVGPKGSIDNGYGDIKISAADMNRLLSYLDSSKHPKVVIS